MSNSKRLEHHAVWVARQRDLSDVKCLANKVTWSRAAKLARNFFAIGHKTRVEWVRLPEGAEWILRLPNGEAFIGPADPRYPSERDLAREQAELAQARNAAAVASREAAWNTARGVAPLPGQPLQVPSAGRRVATCKGCGQDFHPDHPNQLYHDSVCKARYHLKQEQRKQP